MLQNLKKRLYENRYNKDILTRSLLTVYRMRTYTKTYLMARKEKPTKIPRKKEFTLNGKIPVEYWVMDDSYSSKEPIRYTKKVIEDFLLRIKKGLIHDYGELDLWLYKALKKHSIKGKSVAIMGSVKPWYEAICIAYGGKPTTIEYNPIISEDPRLKTVTVDKYNKKPQKFDAAFSISSFEHDGLGRYGDPINPTGDLEAMKNMKKVIKKGGLLFLAVPIGKDTLVWNAHRIYGKVRFPMLIEGWEVVGSVGFSKKLYRQWNCKGRKSTQPIFILKNI
jgi:hypothetical protein